MIGIRFEELNIGASCSSGGRTITETDIVLHAGQSGDFYQHHMDAEWCATQPFKQRIAHGTFISNGIVVEKLGTLNQRGECVMACEHLLLVRRRNFETI